MLILKAISHRSLAYSALYFKKISVYLFYIIYQLFRHAFICIITCKIGNMLTRIQGELVHLPGKHNMYFILVYAYKSHIFGTKNIHFTQTASYTDMLIRAHGTLQYTHIWHLFETASPHPALLPLLPSCWVSTGSMQCKYETDSSPTWL